MKRIVIGEKEGEVVALKEDSTFTEIWKEPNREDAWAPADVEAFKRDQQAASFENSYCFLCFDAGVFTVGIVYKNHEGLKVLQSPFEQNACLFKPRDVIVRRTK